jgi:hypothetical protein
LELRGSRRIRSSSITAQIGECAYGVPPADYAWLGQAEVFVACGENVATGLCFYRLQIAETTFSRKMVLIK